jgi:hypothetical protein
VLPWPSSCRGKGRFWKSRKQLRRDNLRWSPATRHFTHCHFHVQSHEASKKHHIFPQINSLGLSPRRKRSSLESYEHSGICSEFPNKLSAMQTHFRFHSQKRKVSILILISVLFTYFGGTWTQGFAFSRQALYHLSHTSSPFHSGYFRDEGLKNYLPVWP